MDKYVNVARHWWARIWRKEDTKAGMYVAAMLLFAEACLLAVIIKKVPYTEIDWIAYMEEVDGFLEGERDYTQLRGGTGPLVYPAGFVYIFAALKIITGGAVFPAQLIFMVVYLATQAAVFAIYIRSKTVPPAGLVLLTLSKRLHSIYVLRLFNDCIAMLPLYVGLLFMQSGRWKTALAYFSVGVSVKMNVLLMAPGVFMLMMESASTLTTAIALAIAASIQVILGAPFLLTYPLEYLNRSFELGRQFQYKWTVNFRFLPEDIFLSKALAVGLLVVHAILLVLFAHNRWCKSIGGMSSAFRRGFSSRAKDLPVNEAHVALVVFTSNFIGIVCARSLHYQFYSWYYHMIPFLLWATKIPLVGKLVLWISIEICWNIYPSTTMSSVALLVAHMVLLLFLWLADSKVIAGQHCAGPPPPMHHRTHLTYVRRRSSLRNKNKTHSS